MDAPAHPGADDLPYLRENFVALELLASAHGHDVEEVRRAIAGGRLPGPAYVLGDGTELVAPDYFELAHLAGGFDELRPWFIRTYEELGTGFDDPGTGAEQWEQYVSGDYAVCLRAVTPTTILAKGRLMDAIARLTAEPAPDDDRWRDRLRTAVDGLDAIERPFARFDRERWGPVSRDRCVTAVRERFDLPVPSAVGAAAGS